LEEWKGKRGGKPTPRPLKTTKPPFPCNSRNNLFKSLGFSFENFGKEKTYTRPYNLIH
jgi:hypothetical protein